jgi:hypothetical protein
MLVTPMRGWPAPRLPHTDSGARGTGFVPLARVLSAVDAVVCADGMGTVLAVVVGGLPFVAMPRFPSQRWTNHLARGRTRRGHCP